MKVLLIGANGQLGSDLTRAFADDELVGTTRQQLDVCNFEQARSIIDQVAPDVVINTAAFHRVDDCEDQVEQTFLVNAYAVRNLAWACAAADAMFVHLSTDYVFGGPREAPWHETDAPRPMNVYGVSKVAGEQFVRAICPKHLVIRTSGLYGVAGAAGKGGNFVETMIRLAGSGKPVRVVDDQVLTPTYTPHLAAKIRQLVCRGAAGLFHVTSNGSCSWYQFAGKIFELLDLHPDFAPTTTAAFAAKAIRPTYSVLAHDGLQSLGLDDLPQWSVALQAYLAAKGHLKPAAASAR
jgi:dTDP-4-dehydrorhamnose reductase